jgi:hypothetical protein
MDLFNGLPEQLTPGSSVVEEVEDIFRRESLCTQVRRIRQAVQELLRLSDRPPMA